MFFIWMLFKEIYWGEKVKRGLKGLGAGKALISCIIFPSLCEGKVFMRIVKPVCGCQLEGLWSVNLYMHLFLFLISLTTLEAYKIVDLQHVIHLPAGHIWNLWSLIYSRALFQNAQGEMRRGVALWLLLLLDVSLRLKLSAFIMYLFWVLNELW